jgi:hydrogenase-4 membrane subunit HyfE
MAMTVVDLLAALMVVVACIVAEVRAYRGKVPTARAQAFLVIPVLAGVYVIFMLPESSSSRALAEMGVVLAAFVVPTVLMDLDIARARRNRKEAANDEAKK